MSHGDYTGTLKSALAERFRKEQAVKAKSTALATAIAEEVDAETVDLVPGGFESFEDYALDCVQRDEGIKERVRRGEWAKYHPEEPYPSPDNGSELDAEGNIVIEVGGETDYTTLGKYMPQEFRASEDMEDITLGNGPGNVFSIQAGHTYRAPKWVVEHLDSKSLVWH